MDIECVTEKYTGAGGPWLPGVVAMVVFHRRRQRMWKAGPRHGSCANGWLERRWGWFFRSRAWWLGSAVESVSTVVGSRGRSRAVLGERLDVRMPQRHARRVRSVPAVYAGVGSLAPRQPGYLPFSSMPLGGRACPSSASRFVRVDLRRCRPRACLDAARCRPTAACRGRVSGARGVVRRTGRWDRL
jgi:hypothetical protein